MLRLDIKYDLNGVTYRTLVMVIVDGSDDDNGFIRPRLRLIRLMSIPRSHLKRRRYLTNI